MKGSQVLCSSLIQPRFEQNMGEMIQLFWAWAAVLGDYWGPLTVEEPRLSSVQVSPNAKNDLQNESTSTKGDVPLHHIANLVKREEYGLKKTWKGSEGIKFNHQERRWKGRGRGR
ncbi:hypothetical protein SLEP1_g24771 [Rubroshorea leprosula]|uniref:Uncharacterized protein n=1 Tax=Rubroshorea leprosula TaxID=152421 RepID=A0AAV5JGP8_9ROSI|nr:hypothetical protein SLEP1_g24771 [Rubroshorea leprosula]